jgi:hypothetical protein
MPWHASAASALDGCGHCRNPPWPGRPPSAARGAYRPSWAPMRTDPGRSPGDRAGSAGTGSEATSRTGRRSRLQPGQERSEWPEGKEGRSPFLRTSLHLHPQLPLGSPHSPRGTYRKRSRCGIIQGGYVATRGRSASSAGRPPRSRSGREAWWARWALASGLAIILPTPWSVLDDCEYSAEGRLSKGAKDCSGFNPGASRTSNAHPQ